MGLCLGFVSIGVNASHPKVQNHLPSAFKKQPGKGGLKTGKPGRTKLRQRGPQWADKNEVNTIEYDADDPMVNTKVRREKQKSGAWTPEHLDQLKRIGCSKDEYITIMLTVDRLYRP